MNCKTGAWIAAILATALALPAGAQDAAGSDDSETTGRSVEIRAQLEAAREQVERLSRRVGELTAAAIAPMDAGDGAVTEGEVSAELQRARKKLEQAAKRFGHLTEQLTELRMQDLDIHIPDIEIGTDRAVLGINVGGSAQRDEDGGVHVAGVTPDGPADKAGLQAGDVIVEIDDTELARDNGERPLEKLRAHMDEVEPGEEVTVVYRRSGETHTATFATDELSTIAHVLRLRTPHPPVPPRGPDGRRWAPHGLFAGPWADLELAELSPELGEYFGTDKGVLVVKAPEGEDIPLRGGDVILRIGEREPKSPTHAMRILRSYTSDETLNLTIVRNKEERTLTIERPKTGDAMGLRPVPPPAPSLPVAPAAPAVRMLPGLPMPGVDDDVATLSLGPGISETLQWLRQWQRDSQGRLSL